MNSFRRRTQSLPGKWNSFPNKVYSFEDEGDTEKNRHKTVSTLPNTNVGDGQHVNSFELEHTLKNFFDLEPKLIAKYLAERDWEVFKKIKRQDLPQYMSSPELSKTSITIHQLQRNYSQLHYWTLDTILSGQTALARSKSITKFIIIANELLNGNNLNATHAVVSALQNMAIERLDETWQKVSTNKKKMFKLLTTVLSEENNYALLYFYMKEQMDVNKIVIPYIDLVLRDFKALQPLYPDLRVLTIRRCSIVMETLRLLMLKNEKYGSTPHSPEIQYYLDSLFVTKENMESLKSHAYSLSLKLEGPKHRVYKVMNVSDINLADYE